MYVYHSAFILNMLNQMIFKFIFSRIYLYEKKIFIIDKTKIFKLFNIIYAMYNIYMQ